MKEEQQNPESSRKTGEKLWDATRKTFHSASFRAVQYKRVVQKKIDLNAVHKKISALHNDLGRLVDDSREAGTGGILEQPFVLEVFRQLDGLKHEAATLEEEIEAIKAETPAADEAD